MNDILAYPAVYKDVRSTENVPESELQKAFGTTDVFKIAEKIIKEGEIQLTTEQRRQMVEQKRNQIANIISKRGINPQTNSPHPPQRILNVMEKSGVNIDPFSAQYAGKSYSILKNYGSLTDEKWLNDGSLQVNLKILAGMQDELFEKVSSLTHGQFESKIIKREEYGS